MFIIKAVRPSQGNVSHVGDLPFQCDDYMSFQCDYYSVQPSRKDGCNAPGEPPYVRPQREVLLFEKSAIGGPDPIVASLDVGTSHFHYCTVYVMNDRGKTIDTIQVNQ